MTEASENKFKERRSAHIDEGPSEGVPSAAPEALSPPPPETPPAEPRPAVSASSEAPGVEAALDEMADVEIPDASFYEIVQPLEIQALQFLGELPLTAEGERRMLPRWARHVIDLLGILEDRTRGNLTPEEAQYLQQVLADLRLRSVRVVP